ncbi:MAG: hypothetical protein HQK94_15420 [Nitrospirae bacterium]|nr:hypothetical protein [Nitrospirota bacterium]
MNKAIFITVRTASTRLPGKALLEINGKPTIEHLIHRVKRSEKAQDIILCTTHLEQDDILCEIALRNGINYFRGSVKDKLDRWNGACDKFNVEFFVTSDGDDLFCEPELIDLAIEQYVRTQADFIEGKDIICGSFTYGIKASALKRVCEIKDTDDTEMMWVYFKDTNMFTVEQLQGVDEIYKKPQIRMTLDYRDDFRFFETIMEHFEKTKRDYTLRDIVKYLDENPWIIEINQYLHKEWAENQQKKTSLIIKDLNNITGSGGNAGGIKKIN